MATPTPPLVVSPFQWESENKADPAELIATSDGLPKSYNSKRWHTWQMFSLHWLNIRYNFERTRSNSRKLKEYSCWPLTKVEIQQPDQPVQCRFTRAVAGGSPEEYYLERREDGWWRPCDAPAEPIDPEYEDEPTTIFVYWLKTKMGYDCKVVEGDDPCAEKAEKGNIEVIDVTLWTTREAFDAFSGIWTGRHDMLPTLQPDAVTYRRMNHWASIRWTQKVDTGQPENRRLLPQRWTIDVQSDLDHRYEGDLVISFADQKKADPGQFVYKRKNVTPSVTADGQETHYELFVRFLENREPKIYFYKVESQEWFEVSLDEKLPLITHVQAHLDLKNGKTAGHEWVRVVPGFTSSKNEIFMFAKADEEDTIIDRVVLKTIQREPDDLKNDNAGSNIVPVEYAMNQRLDKMKPSSKELFANPRHFSYHPSSDKPYYLYLEYEDGGSLSQLQKSFIKDATENNGPAYLPEIFIWVVFERLLRACYRLHYDRHMRCDGAPRGFITCDIKPANIFLKSKQDTNYQNLREAIDRRRTKADQKKGRAAAPDDATSIDSGSESEGYDEDALIEKERAIATAGTQYPTRAYPIPTLGDLELSLRLGEDRHWDTTGTDGFMAPEQTEAGDAGEDPSRTDVFQIGCVIYSLMRNSLKGLPLFDDDENLLLVEGAIAKTDADCIYDDMYSAGLETLMRVCLEPLPELRPTIKDILIDVQDVMSQFSRSRDTLEERLVNEVHKWSQVPLQDDPFALGHKIGKRRVGLQESDDEEEDEEEADEEVEEGGIEIEDQDEEMEDVEEVEIEADEDHLSRPLSPTPDLMWSGSTSSLASDITPSALYRMASPHVHEHGVLWVDNIKSALDLGVSLALVQNKRWMRHNARSRASRKKQKRQRLYQGF